MKPRHSRGRKQLACVVTICALSAGPTLTSTAASAYAGGGFVHIGSQSDLQTNYNSAIASGDLDSDGKTDVVVGGPHGTVEVLLSDANGDLVSTGAPQTVLEGNFVYDLAIGQFTADQVPDVLAVGWDQVDVLVGDGSGGFQAGPTQDIGQGSHARGAVADLNEDGLDDAVLTGDAGHVYVLLNSGGNPPTFTSSRLGSDFDVFDVTVADLNGDGHADVATLDSCYRGNGCATSDVRVWLGDGRGNISEVAGSPFEAKVPYADTLALTDVNRDHRPDFVVSSGDHAGIMLNRGNGGLTLASGPRTIDPHGGPVVTGYDRTLGHVFLAFPQETSNKLLVFLVTRSGRMVPAPGSPYPITGYPGSPDYHTALTAPGSVDGVPVVFLVSHGTSGSVGNVMADALRSTSTKPKPAPRPRPITQALFNEPGSDPTRLETYEETLLSRAANVAQFDGVPAQIRASIFRISDVALANYFVYAAQHGATVQVLLDGGNRSFGCDGAGASCVNPAYATLAQLNQLGNGNWLKTCNGLGPGHSEEPAGRGDGCIGQARNHNKFLLISHIRSARFGHPNSDVAMQMSTNNTPASYENALNNALVTMNQPAVYQDYVHYFHRLAASYDARKRPSIKRFARKFGGHTDTRTIATHKIATWSFPQAHGHDPLLQALNNVRTSHGCANHSAHTSGPLRNGIAVAMSRIDGRTPVMRRLAQLDASGCDVQVAFAEIGAHDHRILASGGVGLHRVCLARPNQLYKISDYLHSKYVLVGGMDKKLGANRRIVYTGSDNLDNKALSRTDDRLERYVESARHSPIFDAYLHNFAHLLSLSHFGHQSRATCSGDD